MPTHIYGLAYRSTVTVSISMSVLLYCCSSSLHTCPSRPGWMRSTLPRPSAPTPSSPPPTAPPTAGQPLHCAHGTLEANQLGQHHV